MKTVVIGGGWAGTAAAIAARKAGSEVDLIEKTDLLLGCGNAGGIMRNNGRYTAAEEMIALGGGDLFKLIDRIALHRDIEFPGHKHATLYPVNTIEAHVRRLVESLGIHVHTSTHICNVDCQGSHLNAVMADSGERFEGDAFVECTGSAGPMGNCLLYGNGCSMCVLRCPAYGPRVSVTELCGRQDYYGQRLPDVFGVFSGSCKVAKESLSPALQQQLNEKGVAMVPVPKEEINYDALKLKACKQYALKDYSENIIVLDTGDAKVMKSNYPIDKLRKYPGFENARYVDPAAGSKGNSIRYLSLAYRSDSMQVDGMVNLFCGGEKSGLFIGHTEAIATGTLAGANAVRKAADKPLIELPEELAIGCIIKTANRHIKEENDLLSRFTFSGGDFFKLMLERGLYTTDPVAIKARTDKAGLTGIYDRCIV